MDFFLKGSIAHFSGLVNRGKRQILQTGKIDKERYAPKSGNRVKKLKFQMKKL